MSRTERRDVTYHSGHVIEVGGRRYRLEPPAPEAPPPPRSGRQRAAHVARMRDRAGCTWEEIGRALGLSAGRVKALYREARR